MAAFPVIPGYHIEALLGRGGMGIVYAALHPESGRKYAIKMMLVGRKAGFRELARFRVEAEALSCLNHPNIVHIRDVGIVQGCPYFATDFAENGSLETYLNNQLDFPWKADAIRQIATGLAHAHSRKILHRDVKPANILVMADGTPKITDFGLVKFTAPVADVSRACCTFSVSELDSELLRFAHEFEQLVPVGPDSADDSAVVATLQQQCADRTGLSSKSFDLDAIQDFLSLATQQQSENTAAVETPNLDNMTEDGLVMGSPQYMSPEQAAGDISQIGPHTDVYGLGAALYYLVAGKPPFSGRNAWEVINSVKTEAPAPVQAVAAEAPEYLSVIIMKCLEKHPGQRYPTAEMLAEDLDRFLNGRAPMAKLHERATSKRHWFGVGAFESAGDFLTTKLLKRRGGK